MLFRANQEIRSTLRVADRRRRGRAADSFPYAYLDQLILELEELHLDGLTDLPAAYNFDVLALNEILPLTVKRPARWPRRIREAMDVCFDLQEQLLSIRSAAR